MTDHTAAAKIWDRLERALLRAGLLRDGRELRERRAELVRAAGEALGGGQNTGGNSGHLPTLRLDDSAPAPRAERMPAIQHVRIARGTPVAEGEVSRKLDRYLDSSCKAGGYSEDDEVGYR